MLSQLQSEEENVVAYGKQRILLTREKIPNLTHVFSLIKFRKTNVHSLFQDNKNEFTALGFYLGKEYWLLTSEIMPLIEAGISRQDTKDDYFVLRPLNVFFKQISV